MSRAIDGLSWPTRKKSAALNRKHQIPLESNSTRTDTRGDSNTSPDSRNPGSRIGHHNHQYDSSARRKFPLTAPGNNPRQYSGRNTSENARFADLRLWLVAATGSGDKVQDYSLAA